MAEPVLSDFFGINATQTATTVTFEKADLDITPDPNNRAEQIFAGIVKRASVKATQANFETNTDQNITIEPGFDSTVFRTVNGVSQSWNQRQFNIGFAKLQPIVTIDPNDY